ncbi:MAG: response regulator, partial [Proteobacteria bacterium]|nr:response regulator [Pseudomonadota bacterium]
MTKNLKVLLVEDELLIAENVKEMLEDQGHKVVDICTTVTQAAASFSKHNPDLVLLDIKLQGKGSGIELSEMIRKYSSVPIIFVTANSDEKTFQMAIQTSPYGYLTKPVNEKDLTVAVALAVNRHSDAQLRLELESIANNADQFIQLRELTESLIHDVINPLMSAQR